MPPHIPQSRKQLSYPLYAADFDPLNSDFLLVGGGGGSSATGVPNKISLLDVSRSNETTEISDIELAKDEDSVTTLSVTSSSETSLTALAGINSSVADQEAGKNEHLRSFRVSLPPRKRKADGTQVDQDEKQTPTTTAAAAASSSSTTTTSLLPPKALGKTALFASARGPRNETYQRVLRSVSNQSAHELRLTAIASGLAPENEVIVFQPVSTSLTSTVDEISRISLGKTEAADVDLIAVNAADDKGGSGHLLAYCTDDSVYVQRLPGSQSGSSSKIEVPVKAYQAPSSTGSTAPKQQPKFRALRFLTPEHILLLQNRPGRTGASLLILKINNTGSGHITLVKQLDQSIKLATGLDTAIIRSPSSEDFQAIISVASQDSSIDLLTIDYTASSGLSTFRHYALLKNVHSGPLTRLVFSNFIPPPPSSSSNDSKSTSSSSPQRIKLASVGLDKVVVVHTLTLHRSKPATSGQAPRYVLVKSDSSDALQTTISAFTALIVVLLAALLTQAFYEIRGTVPTRLGVANYLPADVLDAIGQPAIPQAVIASTETSDTLLSGVSTAIQEQVSSIPVPQASASASSTSDQATPLVDIVSELASPSSTPKVIVVRDTGDGLSAHVHDHEDLPPAVKAVVAGEQEEEGLSVDTNTDAGTSDGKAEKVRKWEDLSAEEKASWKDKLLSTGFWVEQHGENILEGVLFSEFANVVAGAFAN